MTTYYIYKIYCSDDNITDTYIGSTKNISTRKYQHKCCCNNTTNSKKYNMKVYQIIRANGGWDNWNFVIIEELKECSKIQAHIREEYHRQEVKANMNTKVCFSGISDYNTKEELKLKYNRKYYEDNKQKIKEQKQQHYEDNKEKISIKNSMKIICDCGGKYTTQNKSNHFKSKKHQNYLANLKLLLV